MIRGDVFMRALHRLAVAVGVLALAGGALVMVSGSNPLGGASGGLTSVLALISLLLGVAVVYSRYRADGTGPTTVRDPETPHSSTTPGDDFDEMVYRLVYRREGTLEYREQIRERLRHTAIAAIVDRDDCTAEAAEAGLAEGTWTEDAGAAAFFAEGITTASRPPLSDRLLGLISGQRETGYERRLRQTVDAIYRVRFGDGADALEDEPEGGLGDRLVAALRQRARTDEGPGREEREEGERVAEGVRYWPLVTTGRWSGVTALALVATAVGVLTLEAPLLLVAGVAVVFAGVARLASPPPLANLEVRRRVDDPTPAPGDEVEVTVTVENAGGTFLADLRLIDDVPATMAVIDGSPRVATALRPGASVTFSYTLVAERGEYGWPLVVIGRDLSGMVEREAEVEAEMAPLRCIPPLRTMTEMPVRAQTSEFVGQVDTGTGGAGVEFFSTRDYRPGDPMNRIDWSRHARTGELSTIQFREERAANVVLLFETREAAYAAPRHDMRNAVNRSVDAADDVFAALLDGGNLVGLAAFDTLHCWLAPGAGDEHRQRARQLLTTHPAISPLPPSMEEREGGGTYVDPMRHVRAQLPASTQIVLFTPLADQYVTEVAQRLDAAGHLVTVISPDATAAGTAGHRLARVERALRITRLRERGIRVIDWAEDSPIELELRRAGRRWQAT